jgi:hypothetical protein
MSPEFSKCEKCQDYHFDNEACRPVFIITPTDTGIPTKMHGVSRWHAARGYAIRKWIHIESANELLQQPNIIVDVTDEKGKTERYMLGVEFFAQQIDPIDSPLK